MSLQSVLSKVAALPKNVKIASIGGAIGVAAAATYALFPKKDDKLLPKATNLKGFSPTMNRREAELILNLPPDFTVNDVKNHHRQLMSLHHPDKGGSPYIATKINESRDFLVLGKTK